MNLFVCLSALATLQKKMKLFEQVSNEIVLMYFVQLKKKSNFLAQPIKPG